MFKDFLAKQPIDVIINTEITDTKIIVPVEINAEEFYTDFQDTIEASGLSDEKCIYIAATNESKEYESSIDILNSKIKGK